MGTYGKPESEWPQPALKRCQPDKLFFTWRKHDDSLLIFIRNTAGFSPVHRRLPGFIPRNQSAARVPAARRRHAGSGASKCQACRANSLICQRSGLGPIIIAGPIANRTAASQNAPSIEFELHDGAMGEDGVEAFFLCAGPLTSNSQDVLAWEKSWRLIAFMQGKS